MTLKQALSRARRILAAHNAEDAPLECELLLRHTLKISQVQLYLELNHELSPKQEETFWGLIKRRLNGEPTAYITGHREFYGLDFYVNHRVLIPRPETELLVEMALNLAQNHPVSTIAEIGTGCGAIAIILALKLPEAKIYATDISAPALKVALFNCQKHGVANRVCLLQGNMLDPLPEPVDLIIANLPYVRELELTNSVNFEPLLALNGGSDGLEKIRQLCRQVKNKLRPEGYLLLEIGQGQGKAVTTFLRSLFPSAKIEITPDLGGIDRVVSLGLACSVKDGGRGHVSDILGFTGYNKWNYERVR
ncbi:MAG: peptide chain release factor N(5)-glutamine methyltransferase [Dehalococcoidales bacterium]|nr:peptide chain release factor N(5)-glutamine methyltransferase [Dehalococcoidales bacterium]